MKKVMYIFGLSILISGVLEKVNATSKQKSIIYEPLAENENDQSPPQESQPSSSKVVPLIALPYPNVDAIKCPKVDPIGVVPFSLNTDPVTLLDGDCPIIGESYFVEDEKRVNLLSIPHLQILQDLLSDQANELDKDSLIRFLKKIAAENTAKLAVLAVMSDDNPYQQWVLDELQAVVLARDDSQDIPGLFHVPFIFLPDLDNSRIAEPSEILNFDRPLEIGVLLGEAADPYSCTLIKDVNRYMAHHASEVIVKIEQGKSVADKGVNGICSLTKAYNKVPNVQNLQKLLKIVYDFAKESRKLRGKELLERLSALYALKMYFMLHPITNHEISDQDKAKHEISFADFSYVGFKAEENGVLIRTLRAFLSCCEATQLGIFKNFRKQDKATLEDFLVNPDREFSSQQLLMILLSNPFALTYEEMSSSLKISNKNECVKNVAAYLRNIFKDSKEIEKPKNIPEYLNRIKKCSFDYARNLVSTFMLGDDLTHAKNLKEWIGKNYGSFSGIMSGKDFHTDIVTFGAALVEYYEECQRGAFASLSTWAKVLGAISALMQRGTLTDSLEVQIDYQIALAVVFSFLIAKFPDKKLECTAYNTTEEFERAANAIRREREQAYDVIAKIGVDNNCINPKKIVEILHNAKIPFDAAVHALCTDFSFKNNAIK